MKYLFFGTSLQSLYFYSIGMPLVSILSVLAIFIIILINSLDSYDVTISSDALMIAISYLILLAWSIFFGLLFEIQFDVKRTISILFLILCTITAGMLIEKISISKLLKSYLSLHLFFFYLQLFFFYIFGVKIDYLEPLIGESQRFLGGDYSYGFELFRACGLFNEPGTYATFLAPVIAICEKWREAKTIDNFLYYLGMGSLVLSFSAYGFIFFLLILFLDNISFYKKILLSMLFFVTAGGIVYKRFILRPNQGNTSGLEFRFDFFKKSVEYFSDNPVHFLTGSNILTTNPGISIDQAVNDVGLFFYLVHTLGPLLFTLIVINFIIFHIKLSRSSIVSIFILLISKISIFFPFFPFLLLIIMRQNVSQDARPKF